MAMFGKKTNERQGGGSVAREKVASAIRSAEVGSISLIGPGMVVVGNVSTEGEVRVEGRVQGTLSAGRSVFVGKEGEVLGDITAEAAVIGGRVHGSVTAERLTLQATCEIEGEIRTHPHHLVLEEGAQFNGQVRMLDGALNQAPAALPPTSGADYPVTYPQVGQTDLNHGDAAG
jgi:cytoskeletal protein CcmA (bactofilin family)